MKKRSGILTLMLLVLPLSGWGQDSATQTEGNAQDNGQPATTVPVPAVGQDSQSMPTTPITENPPISGVDQPGLEPHAAPISYWQPGLHLSESVDSNVANTLGNSDIHSLTRALGSLELQRLWSHYNLALDYVGGVGYYDVKGLGFRNIQQLDVEQKVTWKRGEFDVRDSFSYLPEGTFGGAYGASFGSLVTTLGGLPPGLGTQLEGTLGQVPRILNMSLANVTEYLSPKSSLTAAVGYGFVHYTGPTQVQGINFLGSTEISAQTGYDRVVGKHDQLAVLYGYEQFEFSASGFSFHTNIVQGLWGHRVSGRMQFIAGAGPQVTNISFAGTATSRVSVAARASLQYQFPKTLVTALYERYQTNGSGFFTGAETDHATLSASRPISRVWSVSADLGYSHNTREVFLTLAQTLNCEVANPNPSTCPGTIADSFDYGYAGVALHRMFGRNFHFYASYQFNEMSFDPSFCGYSPSGASLAPCNRISQRHVGTIGLDWTPRPMRLD